MGIIGIDLARRGTGDLSSLTAGDDIGFVLVEATGGLSAQCTSFRAQWPALGAVGIARGAYHRARPSHNAADEEADHFLNEIAIAGGLRTGDLVALHIQDVHATGDLRDWTLAWLETVSGQLGFRPLLRSSGGYMQAHGLTGYDDLAEYPLWYSLYTDQPDRVPPPPRNWASVVIHHYSDGGRVAGLEGEVDLDWFTGESIDELRRFGSP